MRGEYLSIYQAGRKGADLTQEAAAELLEVSVESLKAYELGLRVPPNAVVCRMAEAYRADWIKLLHLCNTAGCLGVLPDHIQIQPLHIAAMKVINRIVAFVHNQQDRGLLWIVEDGVVDDSEQPAFAEIMQMLEEIKCAILQAEFTTDRRDSCGQTVVHTIKQEAIR